MICFAVSVLPAPDSPETRMDCDARSFTMVRNAASAMAKTWGLSSPSAVPWYWSIMWWS